MPIEIYTGKPGNGKTALLVERMMKEAAKGERPIVAAGINGLTPGLATILEDPKQWSLITDRTQGPCTCPLIGKELVRPDGTYPPHTHLVPAGALIFVDEAWKWFGHLHDASRQATPPHVLDLAEHRHMGVDFIWTAQGPNQLFPFTRNLIADHYHVVRRFGTQFIDVFKWEELNEEVKSASKRESGQRVTRTIPQESFGKYKSAEVHTIKRSIPWKVWALPFLVLAAILCGWVAYTKLRPSAFAAQASEAGAGGLPTAPPSAAGVESKRKQKDEPMTASEYAALHVPRFATMPHTAPVFDERPALADPLLVCTSTEGGMTAQDEYKGEDCQCMTEQGTRYLISVAQCREVARWGQPYNPYRERREMQADPGLVQPDAPPERPRTAVAVAMGQEGQGPRYGAFRGKSTGPADGYELQGW
jgi:hypothetical protein